MRVRIEPGSLLRGDVAVPGDKSIAHRWLILASTASGRSRLAGLPPSLDVGSTAACLAALAPGARPSLEDWIRQAVSRHQGHGFTWDGGRGAGSGRALEVEGEGRRSLETPEGELDCGNSGTTMRLLAGVAAAAPFRTVLRGDESLTARPMDRIAKPLREMGARVETTDGHPPVVVEGGSLTGIRYLSPVPSAQVKGCVLLAGVAAEGETTVVESVATRDHTERALAALGGPVRVEGPAVTVGSFQHGGFSGTVPGDPSSAAFMVAAAALTGSALTIRGVGLNPSRTRFLDVMGRMGLRTEARFGGDELGEPVGDVHVEPCPGLTGTEIGEDELPLAIDEVPILAILAAHARGESRFAGAGELRLKESDRLTGLVEGIRGLGGAAAIEGDDLVVSGGGLAGGVVDARGDHRMALAFAVGCLGATGSSEIEGMEWADVSFPGFVPIMAGLGARLGEP